MKDALPQPVVNALFIFTFIAGIITFIKIFADRANTKFCPKCRMRLNKQATVCPHCHSALN